MRFTVPLPWQERRRPQVVWNCEIMTTTTATMCRVIATLLVLAFPLGMAIFTCQIVWKECLGDSNPGGSFAHWVRTIVTYSIVYGYLSLPMGVWLHWIIAKKTLSHPPWAWLAIFVSSVMIMVVYYPNGTISGGITLCLLFVMPTFRKMRGSIRFLV